MDTSAISYRVADFLKVYPPFNVMDESDLLLLARRGRVKFFEPNQYILSQGATRYDILAALNKLREELTAGHGARFHTDGDGEAIIAAYHYWGTESLSRLRGMFAFALWDTV